MLHCGETVDPYAGTGVAGPADRDCDQCKEEKNKLWGCCYDCPLSPASAVQSYEGAMECELDPALYHFVGRLFSLAGQERRHGQTLVTMSLLERRGLEVFRHEQSRFEATYPQRAEERRKARREVKGK